MSNDCMNLFVEFIFLIIVLPFELDLYNKLDFFALQLKHWQHPKKYGLRPYPASGIRLDFLAILLMPTE